jgi:long-chain acyl-CoA synthetase
MTSISQMLADDFGTVGDLIARHAAARPDHPALVMETGSLTYDELDRLMDRIGAALQRDGILPGEAISICATTSLEYAALFLGALRVGVAVAPLAPSSTPQQLAGMVADCKARLFFLDRGVAQVMGKVTAPVIALDGQAFIDWLAPEGSKPEPVSIEPSAPFNIIYSSGTTGAPKGIVQSHAMRWRHMARVGAMGDGPDAVSLLSTPLYSNTTLVTFFPCLAGGGTAILMPKFDTLTFLELAQKHRVTHAMLVPVQYRRLMEHPRFDDFDLSSFQMKFCTSAPFPAELKAEVLRRWPGGLVEYFGMTEGGGSCILLAHLHPDKLHTVGQPGPGSDIRLIGEDGVEVPVGEIGEIVGHSAATMNGYFGNPQKTDEASWVSPEGRRYIRTGDVGRFDAEGFLTLMDRKKDMVISGGFNIYPSDLEAVIVQHPAVAEAAVVGVPSHDWGETPVAFVALKSGEKIEAAALREWTNAQLGKTQRLSDLRLVDALPRSHIGKVLKRELRDGFIDAPR